MSNSVVEIVRCGVADEVYALEMAWVRGVDRADRLQPHVALDGSVGVLRDPAGEIRVFSLAKQLGRPSSNSDIQQHVIILNAAPDPVALLVDRISTPLRVASTSLMTLPGFVSSSSAQPLPFRGVVQGDQELLLLADPKRLIPIGTVDRVSFGAEYGRASVWEPAPRTNPGLEHRRSGGGQLVVFSTNAQSKSWKRPISFGLSMKQVLEIMDMPPYVPVPGTPDYLLGVAVWHNRPVAVVDLARRVGLPKFEPDSRTRMLVARATFSTDPIGFVVRPSIRVLRLPLPHLPCIQSPPLDPAMTLSALELNGETLVIPDLASITNLN